MSHDEPMFGETPIANNPEALHDSMVEKGYTPWTPGAISEADAREIKALAGYPTPPIPTDAEAARAAADWERSRKHREPQPLGRGGKIGVTVVLAAILGPFVLLLWHWALGVVGLL